MEKEQKFLSWRNPVVWGFAATALLALLVFYLGRQIGPDNETRYVEFLRSQPNAIGDTLAGIFAPLAFIWIVVTVFLQSHELAEQRRELGLTREELKLAREAQEKQLEVMQKQAEIFEDEQIQRKQAVSAMVLTERLEGLRSYIQDQCDEFGWWWQSRDNTFPQMTRDRLFDNSAEVRNLRLEDFFWKQYLKVKETAEYIQSDKSRVKTSEAPSQKIPLDLLTRINSILIILNDVSPDQIERISRMGLLEIKSIIERLVDEPIWAKLQDKVTP